MFKKPTYLECKLVKISAKSKTIQKNLKINKWSRTIINTIIMQCFINNIYIYADNSLIKNNSQFPDFNKFNKFVK